MDIIPYIEYTQVEARQFTTGQWHYMSHLSNACASEDAHRTSAYAIGLIYSGELQIENNLFVQKAVAPAIFTMGPTVIRKFTDLGTEYDAQIFFFRKEVFLERQTDINYLDRFEFFESRGRQLINLNEEQFSLFKTYFDLVRRKSKDESAHSAEIIRSLIYIILNEIEEAQQMTDKPQSADRETALLSEFKRLLGQHFIEERQVSFYADQLNLTPKYFSTLIRKVSGKTAGEWINEILLLEARVLLQNPVLTIAQISDKLNFSDPSHFSKFFKKHTKMTPLEYRT